MSPRNIESQIIIPRCSKRMSDMICSLEEEAASAGLKINVGKTKVLSLTGSVNRIAKVAAVQIEAVDRFAYLGSIIAAAGGTDMDIENRINQSSVWNVISTMVKQF